jgi:hypothetical protein
MKNQIPFARSRTMGAFFRRLSHLVWMAAVLFLAPPPSLGQSGCVPIDCNSTSFEPSQFKVQVYPDPDHSNVTTGCASTSACGGGDEFRQLFFKVRLLYSTNDMNDALTFDLDYQKLEILLELKVTNALAGNGFSSIDSKNTLECYEATATANGWSNTDNFIATDHDVYVLFEDQVAQQCPEDVISFAPLSSCPLTSYLYCAAADLFTVVVNAYPGEEVELTGAAGIYEAEGESACDLSLSDGDITTGLPGVPVPGSINSKLEVRLLDPVSESNGGCSIDVEIANKNDVSVDVDHIEFVVKVELDQNSEPLEVTGGYNRPVLTDGNDRYIHFVVPDTWTLAADGGTHYIGTITINPPPLVNTYWAATASLPFDDESRVESSAGCTTIPLSDDEETCENAGTTTCTDLDAVTFTVRGAAAGVNDCLTKTIYAGFDNSDPPISLNLRSLEFDLRIRTSGDMEVTGVNFPSSWGNGACPGGNTCLSSCWDWEVDQADPGIIIFHYCMVNLSGPMQIVLDPASFIEIILEGGGCIEEVDITLLQLLRSSDTEICTPPFTLPPYSGIPVCPPQIYGTIATELDAGLEDANVHLALDSGQSSNQPGTCTVSCDEAVPTSATGAYGFCPCPECDYFVVTPEYDENPLNGVSTFDLVLISKHILGLQALDSPYKLIAANASNNTTFPPVTTLDVIEIRKLILGIYSEFPNNTSWRFVDAGHDFPDPDDPFNPTLPENISIDMSAATAQEANFVAVKIGDVNNTALTSNRPAQRPPAPLSWSVAPARAGDAITVPVTYAGADTLEAIQLGLHFDPARLQLLSPSQGGLPGYTSGNFGLAKAGEGEIRSLWLPADFSDPEQRIAPGTVLFYLTFKVLSPLAGGALPLELDEQVLTCAAWRADGQEYALTHTAESLSRNENVASGPLRASVHPNPGTGDLHFSVESATAAKARISLYSPYGARVLVREVDLQKGAQECSLPEAAQLPAGVYLWKVHTKNGERVQGHWVKQ